jgi:hypothetical protein
VMGTHRLCVAGRSRHKEQAYSPRSRFPAPVHGTIEPFAVCSDPTRRKRQLWSHRLTELCRAATDTSRRHHVACRDRLRVRDHNGGLRISADPPQPLVRFLFDATNPRDKEAGVRRDPV